MERGTVKLYLHVGSHKTGTTAIQHFAAARRHELANRGLLYPGFDLVGNRPQRSHLPLVAALVNTNRPTPNLEARQIPDFLDQVRRRSETLGLDVLLSAESVFRTTRRDHERLIGLLRRWLPRHDLVPVAVLRRQDDLADSLYRNHVRREAAPHHPPRPWRDYLASEAELFFYDRVLGSLEELTGHESLVLPYDHTARREIIPTFFDALGATVSGDLLPARRVNHSFDYIDCLAKLRLHESEGPDRIFRRFDRFVRSHPARTEYSFFTTDERRQFLETHTAGNQSLSRARPRLAAVLDPATAPDFPREHDEHCEALVQARLAGFEEFRRRQRAPEDRSRSALVVDPAEESRPAPYEPAGTPRP